MSTLYYNNDSLSISSGYFGSIKLSKVYKGESLIWVFTKPVVLPYTFFTLMLPYVSDAYFYLDSYAGPLLTDDDLQGATPVNVTEGELCFRKLKDSGYAFMSNAKEFYFTNAHSFGTLSQDVNINAFEYHYREKEGDIWVEKSRHLTKAESEKVFSKMTSMYNFFYNQRNIRGEPVCGPLVVNMNSAYYGCKSLTGNAVCGDAVLNMYWAYRDCTGIDGSAACGPNVTDMRATYWGCTNLLYAVCGEKVENMSSAYYGCTSLLTAACSDSVQDMSGAYQGCTNLTAAVCGNSVTNMDAAYQECINLRSAVFGPNVTSAQQAYYNTKIEGDVYLPENSSFSPYGLNSCFSAATNIINERGELRIHVKEGSAAAAALNRVYTFTDNYNPYYKLRRIFYT